MTIAAEKLSHPRTRLYGLICLGALGLLIVWGFLAPLAEGVVASGNLSVDNNRKAVQHLEGGIVRAVAVREGSTVKEGDVILELDDINARAQRDQAAQDVAALLLAQARLESFLAGQPQIRFVDVTALRLDPGVEADLRRHQQDVFVQQTRWLSASAGLIRSRQGAVLSNSASKAAQIAAMEDGLAAARSELTLAESLLEKRLVRLDHVQGLRQRVAAQEADLARLKAEKTQGGVDAAVYDMELAESRAMVFRDASNELVKVKTDLLSTQERLAAAEGVFARSLVRAPRSGTVLNLAATTVGGVVQPGETLMEIVPDNEKLIATVRVTPNDRDSIYEGQDVKVQITAFQSWLTPRLSGKLMGVSADLKTVKETGASYYEARIILNGEDVKQKGLRIRAGMPVEAFISSGQTRTAFDYLFEPLLQVLRRGAVAR
ncbi:protease secretion protein prtE [Asticcacaulis biprosthecium C19]|uniref:Membrane fusion protein (MFP) family protein n=1 Tax=Asticcacaulis biprosthecium C19 TaxID=715226 RepID=F4QP14_9CAUL|nr:HlyD family type I secretion periplasmic adaptor subunit [Asticcacaulis biprosthecium]EGF91072.1 protease secretion protein prtE [Asticcacaulis biprosthecium C19]